MASKKRTRTKNRRRRFAFGAAIVMLVGVVMAMVIVRKIEPVVAPQEAPSVVKAQTTSPPSSTGPHYRIHTVPSGVHMISGDGFDMTLGPDGFPVMVFAGTASASDTRPNIYLIDCGSINCQTRTIEKIADSIIFTVPYASWNIRQTALAIAPDGLPVILYKTFFQRTGEGYTEDQLYYIKCGDAQCIKPTSTRINVGERFLWSFSNIVFDQGLPVFVYDEEHGTDRSQNERLLIRCQDTACTQRQRFMLARGEGYYGSPTVAVGSNHKPIVTYNALREGRDQSTEVALKHIVCKDANCSQQDISTIDNNSARHGVLTSGYPSPQSIIGADGRVFFASYDRPDQQNEGGTILLFSCGDFQCDPKRVTYRMINGRVSVPRVWMSQVRAQVDGRSFPTMAVLTADDQLQDSVIAITRCHDGYECGGRVSTHTLTGANAQARQMALALRASSLPLLGLLPTPATQDQAVTDIKILECLNEACGPMTPTVPENFEAHSSRTSVRLTWDPPQEGPVDSYILVRTQRQAGTTGGLENIKIQLPGDRQEYIDTDIAALRDEPRSSDGYVVYAVNASGTSQPSHAVRVTLPRYEFSFQLGDPSSPSLTMKIGSRTTLTVPVTLTNANGGEFVTVTVSGAQGEGVSQLIASVQPANGRTTSTGTATIALETPDGAVGKHTLTITGTSSTGSPAAQTKSVRVTVVAPLEVSLSAQPAALLMTSGQSSTVAVNVARTSAALSSGTVTLSLDPSSRLPVSGTTFAGLPTIVTLNDAAPRMDPTLVLTIPTAATTTPGAYSLVLKAQRQKESWETSDPPPQTITMPITVVPLPTVGTGTEATNLGYICFGATCINGTDDNDPATPYPYQSVTSSDGTPTAEIPRAWIDQNGFLHGWANIGGYGYKGWINFDRPVPCPVGRQSPPACLNGDYVLGKVHLQADPTSTPQSKVWTGKFCGFVWNEIVGWINWNNDPECVL